MMNTNANRLETTGAARQPQRAVLAVGGLDSSGGAGLTTDFMTITTLGLDAALACSAVTAQSSTGVKGVWPVSGESLKKQMATAFDDYRVCAIKTGMLANEEIVDAVADFVTELKKVGELPLLIIDPVFVAGRGGELLSESGVEELIKRLVPLANAITPNLFEASRLAGFEVSNINQMKEAARKIHELCPSAVVIKGGHLFDSATEIVFDGEKMEEIPGRHIRASARGTGCAFASALAVHMALGMPLLKAVAAAKHMATLRVEHAI